MKSFPNGDREVIIGMSMSQVGNVTLVGDFASLRPGSRTAQTRLPYEIDGVIAPSSVLSRLIDHLGSPIH